MYKKLEKCRICGNTELVRVLDLGEQMLTGVFPRKLSQSVTVGPLELFKCTGGTDVCGLLQLGHSYELSEMYGENYGYRSGLNASMVQHLHAKVRKIMATNILRSGDLVMDIGSNDSTTLQAYPSEGLTLAGVDPTGIKFKEYYPPHINLVPEFFTRDTFQKYFPGRKARVVTSFSMFYDLEDPMDFMRQVFEVLEDDGIWCFEQSYMPTMLETNSYDTVCHEHLEFYALSQIKWMADRVGFKIVDIEFNDVNGGSFSITVAKAKCLHFEEHPDVLLVLKQEIDKGLDSIEPYKQFAERVAQSKHELTAFIDQAISQGKKIAAIGASTKGNVLLQYCELNAKKITYVGEVNEEKYGCFTPGTWIPIIPEAQLLEMDIDYFLILPWHFKKFFQGSNKYNKVQFIYPLPRLEVILSGGDGT